RSILEIRKQGGVPLSNGDLLYPVPVLVGRNERKLAALAGKYQLDSYTADLDAALSDAKNEVYFDSQLTRLRAGSVKRAIDAGKHIYCEKPTGTTLEEALDLYHQAEKAGVKHGVVQDKLWLPGLRKLRYLIDTGFFGRILSVRGEFGYWVFDGFHQAAQRPSWNYRSEQGGSIMIDMFCHWRYVIDNLFGDIDSLVSLGATHIPRRIDEAGEEYECTADDSAYAIFNLKNGIICQFNSSWAVRVRRDDLLTLQVDGTDGTAVAGLRECLVQHDSATPKPVWNPDIPSPIDYYDGWSAVPDRDPYENAFKIQWELFLRHVAEDAPFRWGLLEGAKGVQLAELGMRSWRESKWLSVEPLK
ncbi:MAG: Gfo/Idh/MocA family oxidoreductase, partial [Spirochaetota bacterium]|nr:Gfo/Idh/MocA family oxidoreductase [Spirochaetota bacterium]